MHDLTFAETAVGPCIQCGKESAGSNYWIGMSQQAWDIIRPLIEHMYPVSPHSGERLVTFGRWFFVGLEKPFCGSKCSLEYNKERGYADG